MALRFKWPEAGQAFGNVPRAFRMAWRADARSTALLASLMVVSAALPAAQAWVGKLIIDAVLRAQAARGDWRAALPYLALELGLLLAGTVTGQLRRLAEQVIDHRLGHAVNTDIMRKALALELRYFEDAEFYDRMQNARRQSEYRALAIVTGGFGLAQNLLTLASFLVLLLAFNPWIALLLFGAVVPSFLVQSHYGRLNFRLQSWRAPETRRMQYFEHLLTVDNTAKEIKLFNLGEPLLKRYDELFWKIFREDEALAWRRSWQSLAWGLLSTLAYYGSYAWIAGLAIAGRLTLGDMTLYLALFRQSQGAFQGLFDGVAKLFENGLFMQNLFGFLDLAPRAAGPINAPAATAGEPCPPDGIEFRDVSFRYPHAGAEWTLRHFNLRIRPGEKIALVGENGAGKTTLIKLLTRLYDPTEGSIWLNGRDLRDYADVELRAKLGVIFQDFVKYQLTLRENVGFGSIEHLDDEARVQRAAERGGALDVAARLPEGFATNIGGWFQKGRELSGGQWQKIALSRAFMRESEVLVLDEPTSALDARREHEIFTRFRALTEGKIALLISHRFSTVRMADRIVVLKDGGIEELGTHDELMQREGDYARLFTLQAEGYR